MLATRQQRTWVSVFQYDKSLLARQRVVPMAVFVCIFRLMAVFVVCIVGSATVSAADIRVDPSRNAAAVLEGIIVPGDREKLISFIRDGHRPVEIYLASPGGNLAEAMKIGVLLRTLKLSTVVPSKTLTHQSRDLIAAQHDLKDPEANYMCTSACFFIFVAGIYRSYDLAGPAILGIHRPTLLQNDGRRLGFEQATATAAHVQAVVEKYLTDMAVPSRYAENLYLEPQSKIEWIRNDEFESDFHGFIPELRNSVDAICGKRSESSFEITACERKVRNELALRAYDNAPEIQNGKVPDAR
jgi:hypothetical protein